MGTIYLLHLEKPYKHAKHYLGYSENLEGRLWHHAHGTGARFLQVVRQAGISWVLARTWDGDRTRERGLKNQGGHSRKCPICRQEHKEKEQAMKVTSVSYTRVLSDRCYGNHQATVHADVEEGEDPAVALALIRALAVNAVEANLRPDPLGAGLPPDDEYLNTPPDDDEDEFLGDDVDDDAGDKPDLPF